MDTLVVRQGGDQQIIGARVTYDGAALISSAMRMNVPGTVGHLYRLLKFLGAHAESREAGQIADLIKDVEKMLVKKGVPVLPPPPVPGGITDTPAP